MEVQPVVDEKEETPQQLNAQEWDFHGGQDGLERFLSLLPPGHLPGGKSNLGERAGSVLQFHARIMFGSCSNRPPWNMTLQPFSANFS